ncbi:MAG: response regulator transcription factor [Thermoleophilia bacterium]
MTTRVLVADDQALVRVGLRGILETADDLEVVAEAGTGREAVDLARRHMPDVVLMDVRMPDLDGLQATRRITEAMLGSVIVLTTFDTDENVFEALRGGASGFLLKDTPPAEIIHAVRVVARGDALVAPAVTRRLIAAYVGAAAPRADDAGRLHGLTPREREVLALIGEGASNAEIAHRLVITTGTAKTHVRSLLGKLSVRDRVHLAILAHRSGLTRP